MRHASLILAVTVVGMFGCRWGLPPVTKCEPQTTRCSPQGVPEVCSPARAWTPQPTAEPCGVRPGHGAVCCYAQSAVTERRLHRCAAPTACLPEPTAPTMADSGVEAADSGLSLPADGPAPVPAD